MFSGIYEHIIDEKGRVSLPGRLRDFCQQDGAQSVIITTHYSDPCLQLYPLTTWQKLLTKIAEKPQFDKRMTMLKRFFVAPAMECQIDNHGRLIIPAMHRAHAALEKEVLWVGMIDNLELWDKAAYQSWRTSHRESSELLDDLTALGL